MSGLPSDCTAPPHSQNYPYFKPGEKGWRDCVSSCLMNNSFFQTVPEAPNLWRLVDAKKQQSPAKVIFKKSTSQAASQLDKLTGESLDTTEAAGSSPPQQAIKIVKVMIRVS